jgi:DNA polymerase-3 subunit gamma/tau
MALYRKYRSRSLAEVAGQEHVTALLASAIKNDKVAHAYLFTGPRGVGKTSIARILAHEINGLPYENESNHLDIIEIDAASNNGVEDIRDLRDRVQIAPVSAGKKVYIIDEVHMLSKQAFNALLKTLEEPPSHVVFILATTDIDKVPETIISRTQRHTFRRASDADIIKNLKRIAVGETATVQEEALQMIARHADGSFRDSVSLFDQLLSGSQDEVLTAEHVRASLGLVANDTIVNLVQACTAGDIASVSTILNDLEASGVPARTTASQLNEYLRTHISDNLRYAKLIDSLLDVSKSHYPELKLLTVLALFTSSDQQANVPVSAVVTTPSIPPAAPDAPIVQPRSEPPAAAKDTKSVAPKLESESETPKKKAVKNAGDAFDWAALIGHVRTHHVALHSVLSKCEPELADGTLRLYTKSAFYKKKLDDLKYKTLLVDSLAEIGYDYEIETVATAKPMKDSQAAHVAAIMGGGEEVSVDDA